MRVVDYCVKIDAAGRVHTSPSSWRRTGPDLDLIKQVEQATTYVLAGGRGSGILIS